MAIIGKLLGFIVSALFGVVGLFLATSIFNHAWLASTPPDYLALAKVAKERAFFHLNGVAPKIVLYPRPMRQTTRVLILRTVDNSCTILLYGDATGPAPKRLANIIRVAKIDEKHAARKHVKIARRTLSFLVTRSGGATKAKPMQSTVIHESIVLASKRQTFAVIGYWNFDKQSAQAERTYQTVIAKMIRNDRALHDQLDVKPAMPTKKMVKPPTKPQPTRTH